MAVQSLTHMCLIWVGTVVTSENQVNVLASLRKAWSNSICFLDTAISVGMWRIWQKVMLPKGLSLVLAYHFRSTDDYAHRWPVSNRGAVGELMIWTSKKK